jgi:hypothetical protein
MSDEANVPLPEWQMDETGTPYREWMFEAPYLNGQFVTVQESFNGGVRLRFGPFFVIRLSDGGIAVEDSRKDPSDVDSSTYFPPHRAAGLVSMSQYPTCDDMSEPEHAAVLFAAAELLVKGAGQVRLEEQQEQASSTP